MNAIQTSSRWPRAPLACEPRAHEGFWALLIATIPIALAPDWLGVAATIQMPLGALDHTATNYVAGAYTVFFGLILIYVAIMGSKIARIERQLEDLVRQFEDQPPDRPAARQS